MGTAKEVTLMEENMVRNDKNSSDRERAGKKARGKPAQLQARQSQEARHGTARQEGRQTTTNIPFPFTKFQCAFQDHFIQTNGFLDNFIRFSLKHPHHTDFMRISSEFHWFLAETSSTNIISLEITEGKPNEILMRFSWK